MRGMRDEHWRTGLRIEAEGMRRLWATVALHAVADAATEVAKARRDGNHNRVATEIENFRTWLAGRNGKMVLALAGIDPNERVFASLMSRVQNGDTTFMVLGEEAKARMRGRPRGAGIDE